jgi:hypothetical protein
MARESQHRPTQPLQVALAYGVGPSILRGGMCLIPVEFDDELEAANQDIGPISADHLLGLDAQLRSAAGGDETLLYGRGLHGGTSFYIALT